MAIGESKGEVWAYLLAATLAGCAATKPNDPKSVEAFDPKFASTLNKTAHEAASARPGAKLCRNVQVGISEHDWIRGVVQDVQGDAIGVRVEDAGRHPKSLNGTMLAKGAVIRDSASAWTPCVF